MYPASGGEDGGVGIKKKGRGGTLYESDKLSGTGNRPRDGRENPPPVGGRIWRKALGKKVIPSRSAGRATRMCTPLKIPGT